MPTYEYKCDACGMTFERFQTMTAAPIKRCPTCKKSKVRRLISAGAGLIFKGSGFYITDYRSSSYKEAAKSDSGTAGTSGGGGGGGSAAADGAASKPAESKSEAKSEAKPTKK